MCTINVELRITDGILSVEHLVIWNTKEDNNGV